jgi:hypothetical protein
MASRSQGPACRTGKLRDGERTTTRLGRRLGPWVFERLIESLGPLTYTALTQPQGENGSASVSHRVGFQELGEERDAHWEVLMDSDLVQVVGDECSEFCVAV